MRKTKICPVCRRECAAEARDCPNCPHSFSQDEPVRPRAKFGPASWPASVWVLIVIGALVGAWRLIEFVIVQADPDQQHTAAQSFVEKQRIVVSDGKGHMTVVSAGAAQEDTRARQVAGVARPRQDLGRLPEPEPEDAVVVGKGGPAPAPEPKEWRLRGVVYDLVTLQPIPHCSLFFIDPNTHSRFETSTDDLGSYRTILPSLHDQGYTVELEKEGYARSYLNPGTENVAQMKEDYRRTIAFDLAKTFTAPYEVAADGGAPLKTDFYLAPLGGKRAD